MTEEELYNIAERIWEDHNSNGNKNDKQVWIDGFTLGFTYSYVYSEDLSTFIQKNKYEPLSEKHKC